MQCLCMYVCMYVSIYIMYIIAQMFCSTQFCKYHTIMNLNGGFIIISIMGQDQDDDENGSIINTDLEIKK